MSDEWEEKYFKKEREETKRKGRQRNRVKKEKGETDETRVRGVIGYFNTLLFLL